MDILKSVRNVVLLIMTIALCIFVFMGLIEGKEFTLLMGIVIGFFFGSKAGVPPENTTTTSTSTTETTPTL